ncbi:MAG TPA: DUF262 domain-containing protein, partial [Nitrolancea sp.]|nr:DUF262 domain-containing protein [Nitrolancea sp.]
MAGTQEQATMTFTNITADAVVTTEWLSTAGTTLAVPVYQRQYRWEIDGCERLLRDLRAVAKADAGHTHFLGSILYTATSSDEGTERMLVDGQQRVTTLMLLLAAIRDTLAGTDEAISGVLDRMLQHPTRAGQTRLRLRREGERELAGIVFGGQLPEAGEAVSHLRANYEFFLQEIRDDALDVWSDLQRLEHVAI